MSEVELAVFKQGLHFVVAILHDDENLLERAPENNFFHVNDVLVLQVDQSVQFSQRRNWKAFFFVLRFELHFLDSINHACLFVPSSIDHAVSAFVDNVEMLELLDRATALQKTHSFSLGLNLVVKLLNIVFWFFLFLRRQLFTFLRQSLHF